MKFHEFFTSVKIQKTIDILNNPMNNTCDLEEFIFLVTNFVEVFQAKLIKDERIVINIYRIIYDI